ncbi:MAG: plasmid pRiA4b ORF-3 family protein [Rhizonema sp. PD37]|nr:plasmid pRiA4b ORF-3 family protein [Rhizonema sp. PD37]
MEELFTQACDRSNSGLSILTEEEQQLLHQQTIDENQPSTIIRDFQTCVDFLQPLGIEVSSINNFFPLKVLAQINSKLSHPIEIQLKRPVQKSYPYINGLYLLLRCSGICRIKTEGKKQLLVINEATYQSWLSLNFTERYFTLLESWLLWGNEEILGECPNRLGNLYSILMFWQRIPEQGLKCAKEQDKDGFNYCPGYHNIALLDSFGFLSLKSGKPQKGKGWQIASLQLVPFGNAMLKLLFTISTHGELEENNDEELVEEEYEDDKEFLNITFGEFQPYFQPFFPKWENNLVIPQLEFRDGIYIFKVSVVGGAWRRIAIAARQELSWFAETILNAFDFDCDHLYEFSYKDRFGCTIKIGHQYMEIPPFANKVHIGDLSLEPGAKITYLYDFGDRWEFDVQLEEIHPPNSKVEEPKIVEICGDAPPQYWQDWEEDEE